MRRLLVLLAISLVFTQVSCQFCFDMEKEVVCID